MTEAVCAWPFCGRAELKAAVDVCLDAVPSGERCCSSDKMCLDPDPAIPTMWQLGMRRHAKLGNRESYQHGGTLSRQVTVQPGDF